MLGILFAIGSLLSWGFGDFFIQKTTRAIGIWKALFFVGITGFVGLFPFIKDEAASLLLQPQNLLLLGATAIIAMLTGLVDFEALKEGKIAVVEPIISIELLITVGLSVLLWGERIGIAQGIFILTVFLGIVLAVTRHHTHLHYHKRIFEKGVLFAALGAVGMALVDFLIGVASLQTSPLLTIWVTHSLIFLFSFLYLIFQKEAASLFSDITRYPSLIITQSVLDNAAWIFYAFAVTYIPISIAVTFSEGYVALAVLLGIFVNHEELKWHQLAGIALTTLGIIALSAITIR